MSILAPIKKLEEPFQALPKHNLRVRKLSKSNMKVNNNETNCCVTIIRDQDKVRQIYWKPTSLSWLSFTDKM